MKNELARSLWSVGRSLERCLLLRKWNLHLSQHLIDLPSSLVALHHFIFIIQNWWVCRKKSFYNACFFVSTRHRKRWEWDDALEKKCIRKTRKMMIDLRIITKRAQQLTRVRSPIFGFVSLSQNILIFFFHGNFLRSHLQVNLFSSSFTQHRRNGLQVVISFLSFITSFMQESSWHSSDVYNLLNQYWCSSH
jgi:hypothetical protein